MGSHGRDPLEGVTGLLVLAIFRVVSWPYPAAHTLVDLRIAGTVTHPVARPYFRPAGLSIGRVGFAPTGGLTEFQSVSPPPSFRTSLAWSLLNILAQSGTTFCRHNSAYLRKSCLEIQMGIIT